MSEPYWEPLAGGPGPQGPAGAQGTQGVQGPAGAAATIPARLAPGAQVGGITVTDWNNAVESGWYDGNAAANGPVATWLQGEVIAHRGTATPNYITQRVWTFTDPNGQGRHWQRQNINGAWGAWVLLGPSASVNVNTMPTTELWEGRRHTLLTYDHWHGNYKANDFIYMPSAYAARPWFYCGGYGWRRYFGNVYGGAGGWAWQGSVFDAPFTGDGSYRIHWREDNGPGESNGIVGIGTSGGGIPIQYTVYDTAAARTYIEYQSSLSFNVGESWGIWALHWDSGNPAVCGECWLEIIPIRGG